MGGYWSVINFPTLQNIYDRIRSDIRSVLPQIDPSIENSFAFASLVSLGGRAYDLYLKIQQLLEQFFPSTSTGIYLERWAEYEGLTRLEASVSVGNAVFTGTAGSVIPLGATLINSDDLVYETLASTTIVSTTLVVTLTRDNSTVTASAGSTQGLASGMTITISGADQDDYNGSFIITVVSATQFTYELQTEPATPATGTIIATVSAGMVEVESQEVGSNKNLDSGSVLNLVTPITGVDSVGLIDLAGLSGGADLETDNNLRNRVFQSRRNPVANFNESAIERQALTIVGVTDVFIKRVTPHVGAVTIYFLRRNDTNPIPDAGEVTNVRNAILEILPANSSASDVIVASPTRIDVDFTFTSLTPDTPTMRESVRQSLIALFEDTSFFETNVTEDIYRSAIIQTIDPDTGDSIESFNLSAPTGDVDVSTGEIALLGEVTFDN